MSLPHLKLSSLLAIVLALGGCIDDAPQEVSISQFNVTGTDGRTASAGTPAELVPTQNLGAFGIAAMLGGTHAGKYTLVELFVSPDGNYHHTRSETLHSHCCRSNDACSIFNYSCRYNNSNQVSCSLNSATPSGTGKDLTTYFSNTGGIPNHAHIGLYARTDACGFGFDVPIAISQHSSTRSERVIFR